MAVTSIVMKNQTNFGAGDSTASTSIINVPSDFSTLQEALNYVESKPLWQPLTIQIADGTYNVPSGESFVLQHPNYQLVSINGNTTTPSNVTFNFSGSVSGAFYLRATILKALKGIKINCASAAQYGIFVNNGAIIGELYDMEITGATYFGLIVHNHSTVNALDVNIYNNSNHGFYSVIKSLISVNNPTSQNNGGYGFCTGQTSNIRALGSITVSGNATGSYSQSLNTLTADGSYIANA